MNIPHCICEEPAHPRACGENFIPRPRAAPFGGSSPRMRGKLTGELIHRGTTGLIPAHAGKTLGGIRFRWSAWAHPRVCGENPPAFYCRYGHPGSSPRMRGKRNDHAAASTTRRLIPAHAGKTTRAKLVAFHAAAHPRACGENFKDGGSVEPQQGSSPRMRGKLSSLLGRLLRPRLIPAHAGKTFNG